MIEERIKKAIRDVKDFPKPGIVFKDITPIFQDHQLCNDIIDHLYEQYSHEQIDTVVGIESRGFFFGFPLAMKLGVPFVPIRKKGKLPYDTVSHSYNLEYGSAEVEVHSDAIHPGMKILVHDDLLATGGTAKAAAELIAKLGAEVLSFDFLVELSFLEGRKALEDYKVDVLVSY